MKITAIEEYGLRIIIRVAKLATGSTNGLVSLNDIASHEGISVENTAAILSKLKEAELIESIRGKYGGYKLKRPTAEINLYQLVKGLSKEAFNIEFCETHTGQLDSCVHMSNCSLRPIWSNLANLVNNYLASITLEQLLQDEQGCNESLMNSFGVLRDITEKNLELSQR